MREAKCCTDVTSEAFGVADGADVPMERVPPMRAAAKRRRGLCQVGLADGREGRSLWSPNEGLTAERRGPRKSGLVFC